VPGWPVYVSDGGLGTGIAEAAHPSVSVANGGRARTPVGAHEAAQPRLAGPWAAAGMCRWAWGGARDRHVAAGRPLTTILAAMTVAEAMVIARRRAAAMLTIPPLWARAMVMMPQRSEDGVIYVQSRGHPRPRNFGRTRGQVAGSHRLDHPPLIGLAAPSAEFIA
jgi:hypothetical protein